MKQLSRDLKKQNDFKQEAVRKVNNQSAISIIRLSYTEGLREKLSPTIEKIRKFSSPIVGELALL